MISQVQKNISCYFLKNFSIETLVINSKKLKNNPLKDSPIKYNLVLKPKSYNSLKPYKLVLVLSGFSGNAGKSFAYKSFQQNYPQKIDRWYEDFPRASECLFLFVDAMTFWGGSQFINSPLVGNYEDYIVKELFPQFCQNYSVSKKVKDIMLMGGSSGGYGALHLASRYPEKFGTVAAVAPDCDFDLSLKPELYHALPLLEKCGGINGIRKELKEGKFFRRKEAHLIINVVAMAYCYSDKATGKPRFPFCTKTGLLDQKEWKQWLKKDPLYFIKKRKKNVEKLNGIFLDVGAFDQFNLQYGARKLSKMLKTFEVPLRYSEFKGNHFDIGSRYPEAWQWFLSRK